jgi:carbon starvation protein
MAYWYHFAIMFEALFILTTIDTGTRIARFVLQEFLGKAIPKFEKTDWMPGAVITSALTVFAWGYFIYTGSIATIWPMFGIANQLLAVIALCVGTSIIVNSGKSRYAWVTAAPMTFVLITTSSAAYRLIVDQFLPMGGFRGYMNLALTVLMVACTAIVLVTAAGRWRRPLTAVSAA